MDEINVGAALTVVASELVRKNNFRRQNVPVDQNEVMHQILMNQYYIMVMLLRNSVDTSGLEAKCNALQFDQVENRWTT